jgi:hypothetical protein
MESRIKHSNGTTRWSDGPDFEPFPRMLGDNSLCKPEEKKYNRKKDMTKNGIAYLSLDDCSMVE